MHLIDLAISIVNWNASESILECLESIQATIKEHTYDIHVVDNDSRDGSLELVRSNFPQVQIYCNPENIGYARGQNQVLAQVCTRYVLLLNPDTLINEGTIDYIIKYMDAHPHVGIAVCRVLAPDNTSIPSIGRYPSVLGELLRSMSSRSYPFKGICTKIYRRRYKKIYDDQLTVEVPCVAGPFLMARQEMISDIGLLDEDFFLFSEESDWCKRAQANNWACVYVPDVSIHHLLGKCRAIQVHSFSEYHFHRSRLLFFLKHCPCLHAVAVAVIYIICGAWGLLFELAKLPVNLCMGKSFHQDCLPVAYAPMKAVWHVLKERWIKPLETRSTAR